MLQGLKRVDYHSLLDVPHGDTLERGAHQKAAVWGRTDVGAVGDNDAEGGGQLVPQVGLHHGGGMCMPLPARWDFFL